MTEILTGKVALVTGASRGIGAAIAKGFAAAGAAVVVNYANSRSAAEAVVSEIMANGGSACAVQGDVSEPEQVLKLFAEVKERHGRLDILVNNVGVATAAPIEAVTSQQFYELFSTNVLGLLLTSQAALPLFGPAGGAIINISALAGQLGSPGKSVYAGSKGAVDAITITLSKELGSRQIRVNAISPGAVVTKGLIDSGFLDSDRHHQSIAMTPLGRLGTPEDIANAAIFLGSDASSWITGQIISAAGGMTY